MQTTAMRDFTKNFEDDFLTIKVNVSTPELGI